MSNISQQPEFGYAERPLGQEWPADWLDVSNGTLAFNQRMWELGFVAAHESQLHEATTPVPEMKYAATRFKQ